MILRAKHIIDADFRLIDNGFVRTDSSRIVEVGPSTDATDEVTVDCGDSLLMPGLVNAHTHLELGGLRNAVPPTHDFVDWLARLVPMMRSMGNDQEDIGTAVKSGLQDSLIGGATHVADISRFATITRESIANIASRPRVTSFGEVLGSKSVNPDELIAQSADCHSITADLTLGISPHSTYTVPLATMQECVSTAARLKSIMCIHAAESVEEEEFVVNGTGPLRDFLESMGACDSSHKPFGGRPIEFLNHAGALGSNTLLAHCNHVNDDDINLIASNQTSVVYCPRTHHAFGHPSHRFDDMLRAGINVCLGTDSLASNPSLSMLDEIRFLRSHRPDISAETIMRMATVNGEKALCATGTVDVLSAGSQANMIAIPIDPTGAADPFENVLASAIQPTHCMVAGNLLIG
ncbi:MAG: chlorohydrolase [Phycisphaerae bacterium]|nr:MAG: chlorohydrolase [Phycisphaerae bacterium]